MNPVAFKIFGIEVMWYGVLISIGVVIGAILAIKEAKRQGIDEDTMIDLLLYAIPIALIGARLHYVIFNWNYYKDDLLEIFNFRGGGLAIHGALIAAIIVAIIFTRKKKIDFWKVADACAPSLILGQAIGRWGNYINQEAYGRPTDLPWGIVIDGVKVHPTFLYESLCNFIIFLFLLWYRRDKPKVSGEVFLLYLALYSVIRFFVEGLRIDSLMLGSIRVAQLISILAIIVSIYYFKKRRQSNNLQK
ncbi:prolipoprotein diacylglyceryl transferase [Tepidimicrobium xylanilyticum]|uniref:Phosphatidylglycerol--prolipoprotein diacylglyceryl transferase n=1 Tax=Tepidimicrobium xylanilyticum TaxID=1123352 RepID=A0A1H2SRD3_9FIRM|nr:prolipoprotein diacylglyceryl transferase [Tepidimicrobium xylanilyticum]GMG96140.1 prolipoprotein diacylglyceryl transferase [Tepidimicrobium xylanilyticum]SDW34221.1 phosphatidylglycerol:prolipoprotein diacylglycerol transferase [Tepidimicrobium xylanilyticum]